MKRKNNAKKAVKTENAEIIGPAVRFTQTLLEDHYKRVGKAAKVLGLQSEQDVVRIAVANFLTKQGF